MLNLYKPIVLTLMLMVILTPGGMTSWAADNAFDIRGTLPWHNFLSGPTTWDFEEYKDYLDWMSAMGMNFVGFHCYTGGAERYVNYVEPLIRVEYKGILPPAFLDTSVTARWGYRPLETDDFFFGTRRPFRRDVFGAECAVRARDQEDRYRRAQDLMNRVMDYAHRKEMKFCIGFEFGIYPPEFFSVLPPGSMIYNPYLPDPLHPANIELLDLYISDILEKYPDIDYMWFWLQELYNPSDQFRAPPQFSEFYKKNEHYFSDIEDVMTRFYGVWSMAYIQKAHSILKKKAPTVRMAISGWGGDHQLPPLLPGLDKAVPKDIIFACLNKNQGWDPQPAVMGELKERDVWVIPWLEGDRRLWHPQPRVSLLAEQIGLAHNQGVDGVIGIHWRTEDIRANFEAMALMTKNPPAVDGIRLMTDEEKETITSAFYQAWCERRFGRRVGPALTPFFTRFDCEQIWAPRRGGVESPEYYPYTPNWGFMTEEIKNETETFLEKASEWRKLELDKEHLENLDYLVNTLKFILLLHETGVKLQPAYNWRWDVLLDDPSLHGQIISQRNDCLKGLQEAPVEDLFETYALRIRSQGERGVLSSMNQKLGLLYRDLNQFFEKHPF